MRHLRHGGVSYSQLAQYVISQCVNIEGGIGEYKVIWSANHRAARLGMIGRPVSGLRAAGFPIGSEYPPELASDPLVPHAFVGVSTFHMPGILSSSKTELRKNLMSMRAISLIKIKKRFLCVFQSFFFEHGQVLYGTVLALDYTTVFQTMIR